METLFEQWPFLPKNNRTPEQDVRWWNECYVPNRAMALFETAPFAAAVVGGPGSGKTTAMADLIRRLSGNCLLVPYETQRWPGGKRPWLVGKGHISQIMAAAATEIVARLEIEPARFSGLDGPPLDFLYWLISAHLNRRTLQRLIRRISQDTGLTIPFPAQIEALYDTDTEEADVWNMIAELAELSQALGFERVAILIDLDEPTVLTLRQDLEQLLTRIDLMEHKGCLLRVTLPANEAILELANRLSRDNLQLIRLDESLECIRAILSRYLAAASDGKCDDLIAMAEAPVIERAEEEIQRLYGSSALAGWLQWAQTLSELFTRRGERIVDVDEAVFAYYARHIPLKLADGRQGVWRGPEYIALDRSLYDVLTKLFQLRGESSPDALVRLANNSPTYLNTLMSRLRSQIEPPCEEKLYIRNSRNLGYWLENFIT